jgi:hypothetical protein
MDAPVQLEDAEFYVYARGVGAPPEKFAAPESAAERAVIAIKAQGYPVLLGVNGEGMTALKNREKLNQALLKRLPDISN